MVSQLARWRPGIARRVAAVSSMPFLISTVEQHDLFGDFLPASYAREAEQRWSATPEWHCATGRVADYGLIEWQEIQVEQADWERRLVYLLTERSPATGEAAMDLAEEHRRQIERWLHPCSPEHHVRIAEFIFGDASFRTRYDGLARGAARYVRDAIHANAVRHNTGAVSN
jgi:hypothetical protein